MLVAHDRIAREVWGHNRRNLAPDALAVATDLEYVGDPTTMSPVLATAVERHRAAQFWTGSKDFLVRIARRSITGRRVVPRGLTN